MSKASPALVRLIRETRQVFHVLRDAADRLHADLGLPAGQRAILENLVEGGAKTVPELARMRPVSRQFVQGLANALLARGLIEAQPNPGHRRSPRLAATAAGKALFATVRRREAVVLAKATEALAGHDLAAAADGLAALRDYFAATPLTPPEDS